MRYDALALESDETIPLSGTIPNEANGYGALVFYEKGIQNGPDGIALVNKNNEVQQYISYGGKFTCPFPPSHDGRGENHEL